MTHLPLLLLVLAACDIDQQVAGKPPTHFDSGDSPTVPDPTDDSTAPLPEECNGVDDDGDGEVDEGFADEDDNGLADCLQADCSGLVPPAEAAVPVDPTTVPWDGEPVVDPWDVEIAWDLTAVEGTNGTAFEALASPLVLTARSGSARVATVGVAMGDVDYGQGRVLLATPEGTQLPVDLAVRYDQNGAAADVDADGNMELFFHLDDGSVGAFTADGVRLWEGDFFWTAQGEVQATVADLFGDGSPEVIFDDNVYDARTGELVVEWDTWCNSKPQAIGDLDLDGVAEVVICDTVYSPTGAVRWVAPIGKTWELTPLLVQADVDPEGEVAFIHQWLSVFDTDGSLLAESEDLGANYSANGPPCAADFDGDGEMEVAWPDQDTLYAFNLDGTPLWTAEIQDSSTWAGCTASDLDGNGVAEILYMDEVSFTIFDGATGTPSYRDETVRSSTAGQSPVVVDLDGDGHTEVVIAMGDAFGEKPFPMLRAYRHAGDGWTPGGTVWSSSDYSMVNVNPDGTVPRTPEPSWSRYGVFRGHLASADGYPLAADLSVAFHELCVEDCADGPVEFTVQVTNHGSLALPEGTSLAVYALDAEGDRLARTLALPPLPAATAAEGFVLSLAPGDLGIGGVRIAVDDDGTGVGRVREVDEDNNAARWQSNPCP